MLITAALHHLLLADPHLADRRLGDQPVSAQATAGPTSFRLTVAAVPTSV